MNIRCNKSGTNRLPINDRFYMSYLVYSGTLQFLALRDKFNDNEKLLDIHFETGLNARYFKDKICIYHKSQMTTDFLKFITAKFGNNFKVEVA